MPATSRVTWSLPVRSKGSSDGELRPPARAGHTGAGGPPSMLHLPGWGDCFAQHNPDRAAPAPATRPHGNAEQCPGRKAGQGVTCVSWGRPSGTICGWGEKGNFRNSGNWERPKPIPTLNPVQQEPWPGPYLLIPFPASGSSAACLPPCHSVSMKSQADCPPFLPADRPAGKGCT